MKPDDETYLVREGEGCFLFRRNLLNRAARTLEVRRAGNKYEVIAAWLLEGLANISYESHRANIDEVSGKHCKLRVVARTHCIILMNHEPYKPVTEAR